MAHLNLGQEIAFLRTYMVQVACYGTAHSDLIYNLEILCSLSIAATAIIRLVQTDAWLSQVYSISSSQQMFLSPIHPIHLDSI